MREENKESNSREAGEPSEGERHLFHPRGEHIMLGVNMIVVKEVGSRIRYCLMTSVSCSNQQKMWSVKSLGVS